MSARVVALEPTWEAFRLRARSLLRDGVPPERATWLESGETQPQLSLLAAPSPAAPAPSMMRVPRRFIELGETVACHRDPAPWPWLYRVLWRLGTGERTLLDDAADADIVVLAGMHRAVRRDMHKMKAFVRFRSVRDATGERFVAWFEPKHRIVRRTAPFFERRFPSMRWSILTPDACVHWDGEALTFGDGVSSAAAPGEDALEAFWLTYYAHTFNPARVRVQAMRAEMPVYYWRNMPEAAAIPSLLREAPARVRTMLERAAAQPAPPLPPAPPTPARPRPSGRPRLDPPPGIEPIRVPKIRIGVAGWDYPDWAGRVYPEGREGIDRLRWVAARFDLIEVNSTFYRPASSRATRSWLERTADWPQLRFAAKLHRVFTHERGPWRDADVAAVHAGMLPLLEAGRLVSLLVQFPWSFRNRPAERRRLKRIADAFAAVPLHVEVRHATWDDDAFRHWLRSRGIGLANIDQPLFDASLGPSAVTTNRVAYLRLHGRNAANWFRRDATRDERYDYDYSAAELVPWAERAARLAGVDAVDEVAVVFNNHYRAQAVNNAAEFARLLDARAPRQPWNGRSPPSSAPKPTPSVFEPQHLADP